MTLNDIFDALASSDASATSLACERLVDVVLERTLTPDEIARGAERIAASGAQLQVGTFDGGVADVPSSGAPGSLSTLLCPYLLVACGVRVPKISASGSVAGGIDTLALLPGFKAELEEKEARRLLATVGMFHSQQSAALCPADGILIGVRRRRQMMANPSLAAISLLSKKLAVPGTRVVLDFRVGPEGNIGVSFEAAAEAARLLSDAAKVLGLAVVVVLTDNRKSPTSAIGRLESLRLLLAAMQGSTLGATDTRHVSLCVQLAARAVALARGVQFSDQHTSQVYERLIAGSVMDAFQSHIAAQGAKVDASEFVRDSMQLQVVTSIVANERGTWFPPALEILKRFAKNLASEGDTTVGYRSLVEPGSEVLIGQPIAEVRTAARRSLPFELSGTIVHGYTDAVVIE